MNFEVINGAPIATPEFRGFALPATEVVSTASVAGRLFRNIRVEGGLASSNASLFGVLTPKRSTPPAQIDAIANSVAEHLPIIREFIDSDIQALASGTAALSTKQPLTGTAAPFATASAEVTRYVGVRADVVGQATVEGSLFPLLGEAVAEAELTAPLTVRYKLPTALAEGAGELACDRIRADLALYTEGVLSEGVAEGELGRSRGVRAHAQGFAETKAYLPKIATFSGEVVAEAKTLAILTDFYALVEAEADLGELWLQVIRKIPTTEVDATAGITTPKLWASTPTPWTTVEASAEVTTPKLMGVVPVTAEGMLPQAETAGEIYAQRSFLAELEAQAEAAITGSTIRVPLAALPMEGEAAISTDLVVKTVFSSSIQGVAETYATEVYRSTDFGGLGTAEATVTGVLKSHYRPQVVADLSGFAQADAASISVIWQMSVDLQADAAVRIFLRGGKGEFPQTSRSVRVPARPADISIASSARDIILPRTNRESVLARENRSVSV